MRFRPFHSSLTLRFRFSNPLIEQPGHRITCVASAKFGDAMDERSSCAGAERIHESDFPLPRSAENRWRLM